MFGSKRRRATSNPPLNASNANPSATSAATQAFFKNQASTASLSSAAAAAALRSRPTTPTSVADVQTKRTIRRAGSTSSVGSSRSAASTRGPPGAHLERRSSSSSMTERTFRDPSPKRHSPVPSALDAPPVPAIPKNLSKRRTTSLDATPRRLSSPPNTGTGRGSSLQPVQESFHDRGQRTSISDLSELTRPQSRGSVNFSYPTRGRAQSLESHNLLTSDSPSRQPRITAANNTNLIYDPNTRSFLPAAEIYAIEQRLWNAANAPVKKQKRIAPKQATGTHLADGTVGGRPRGTAIDAMEASKTAFSKPDQSNQVQQTTRTAPPRPEPLPETREEPAEMYSSTTESPAPPVPAMSSKRKKKVTISESGSDTASNLGSDYESDASVRPAKFNTRAGALLVKKPSLVKEDREREEKEDDTPPRSGLSAANPMLGGRTDDRAVSPSPLPRSQAGRAYKGSQPVSPMEQIRPVEQQTNQHTAEAKTLALPEPVTPSLNGKSNGTVKSGRPSSVSPTRTAHFMTTPENLAVKHQPPGRSVSPRKSALKHSPSNKEEYPGMLASTHAGSEISDNSVASDEHLKPKKKSVRVSFDDESNVIVGNAAPTLITNSPVIQSPQVKSRWFSMAGRKKKEVPPIEDEEVMKPRPALPSFGSVREKKNREVEERPLVMPIETSEEPPVPKSPTFTSATGEPIEFPLGQSNDHVVGTIIAQDFTSRNAANISKSREPLPPEVTSVEGSGYMSDSSSTYSVEAIEEAQEHISSEQKTEEVSKPFEKELPEPVVHPEVVKEARPNGSLPKIALLPPTPKAEDEPKQDWLNIPGAWGDVSDTASQAQDSPTIVEHVPTEPTLAAVGIGEPLSEEALSSGSPPLGYIAASQYHHAPIQEETEDSDSSAIYSDAAEDLSDLDGDGFMSLDAVVDSPISRSVPDSAFYVPYTAATPSESAIAESTAQNKAVESDQRDSELETNEGWGKAQQYWSGLTADKKRQLEEDALDEAAGQASGEDEPTPKPKKTKKKVAVKAPEESVSQHQPAFRSDRTYMIAPGSKAGPDGHTPVQRKVQKSAMRNSMRAEPAINNTSSTQMRKSMRENTPTGGSMRSSMREAPVQQKGSLQKKHRPVSLPASASAPAPINTSNGNMPAGIVSPPKPSLRRKSSQDSDSSFKRSRVQNESRFRGSMRGSSDDRPMSPVKSSRFSLRSLSPAGSTFRRPFNSQDAPPMPPPPAANMRNSLNRNRDSYESPPSLRKTRTKSPTGSGIFGLGRSTKPVAPAPKPQSRSRFADSDSDEETARPAFRSRFADSDSDDDDLPKTRVQGGFGRGTMRSSAPTPKSTPLRSIPAGRRLDEDSSDLPDSDDGKSPRLLRDNAVKTPIRVTNGDSTNGGTASGAIRRSGSGRGTISSPAPSKVTPRPNHNRRGSFMSILKRKKPDPNDKVRKSDAESPARRDTHLERSKTDLTALYSPSQSPSRVMSPKLQKRNPMSRENSTQAWPLAPPPPPNVTGMPKNDDRPFTADGTSHNAINGNSLQDRPEVSRRFTATGLSAIDLSAGPPETPSKQKKKKFGALRKMFKLDD